ncbi:MAG: PQQ-binding-like beta-propeller repeat protein, partial [Planctomycetota bacterium]
MKTTRSMVQKIAAAALLSAFILASSAALPAEGGSGARSRAQKILQQAGARGGLVVHVGCSDGRLTAALRANDSYVVQGLDKDADDVQKTRELLAERGLYGEASAVQWRGQHLPYVNNLVDVLVISAEADEVPEREMMRVLSPRGTAFIQRQDGWTRKTKPRPGNVDDWTHALGDSTNNAVSNDTAVGPPRSQQWFGEPRWSRHHEQMSSISAAVSSGGRLFYIVDRGSYVSPMLPSDWRLVARDGHNGVKLWSRPMGRWASRYWPMKNGPSEVSRRLVATDGTVYVTLGIDEPVAALDPATGEKRRVYEATENVDEFVVSGDALFAVLDEGPTYFAESEYRRPKTNIVRERNRVFGLTPDTEDRTIVAVNTRTGETLWKDDGPVATLGLAADDQHVAYHNNERVVCLDRETGEKLWQSRPLKLRQHKFGEGATLVLYRDMVLFSGDTPRITALSVDTGEVVWSGGVPKSGHRSAQDVFAIDGAVWSGTKGRTVARDLQTGKVLMESDPGDSPYWFHDRCHRARATSKFLLLSRTGTEFVDVGTGEWDVNHWVRGTCHYGLMPANGLLYTPPHPCACYMESKLTYFNALAPEGNYAPDAPADGRRLAKGPAYGEPAEADTASGDEAWPTYRRDNARSGATPRSVSRPLQKAWEVSVGEGLTALTAADGKVFGASREGHFVYALDAGTGETLWRFRTGGPVDSPPTIAGGRAYVGSTDGNVYCLQTDDGALVWRYRAAPDRRQIMGKEQLRSPWPVHGSVL